MNLEAFFSSPFHARLVLTLGHFLWQAAAIAVLAWVAIALLRRSSSQLRYGVLAAALVAMAACPPVTFCFLRPSAEALAEPAPPERGPGAEQAFVTTPEPIVSRTDPVRQEQRPPSTPPRSAATLAEAPSEPEPPAVAGKRSWKDLAAYLTAVYVLGVAVMLGRLLLGLSGGRKLRKVSEPAEDPTLLSLVAERVRTVGLGFTPALAYCRQVAFPTVVGVLRPMILLPLSLASGLSGDELGAMLAHELAHIRRYDHIFNLFQRVIEALLFFHPAVWLISRQIRLEREKCCDDLVVAAGGEPLSYASSLVRMAEICLRGRQTRRRLSSAALAAGDKPSQLRSRVARLIGAGAHEKLRLSRTGALAIVLMVAALVGASLFVNVKAEPATQPAESAAGYAQGLARSFALLVAKQKLGFLAEKDAQLLESEMSAFLRAVAPREPSAALQAALSASLERYVPAYFTDDDETYLALRDRINTLKVKLWWALSAGKLTPGQAKRREFQRLWMHEYIDSVPENPTALAANRLGPGGLRAMAHDQLQRFLEDPLSPLYYVMTSQQFQALQDRVKGRWEKLLSQPDQPFDRPDRVPFSCLAEAWRMRLPGHNDPKDPSKMVYEVILPFQDRIEGWNISQGLNLRFASNAAFRGSQVQLDTMRTGGLPRNAVNVVTGKWLNYPQALQRTAIHSPERMRYMKRHGGMDLVLNVQPAALVGLRGARLARLEVPGWQGADAVSNAALAELIQRDGAESVSVARFPLWPYGAKQPAPMFLALRTGQGRLAVVRIVYRHQHPNDPTDGTVCIHYRLRRTEAGHRLVIPKPATARQGSPQAQPAGKAETPDQPGQPKALKVGDVAPDFVARTLDGTALRLRDFRGKFVLLNFWATWCGPCIAETPALAAAYDAFGRDDHVAFINLSVDRDTKAPMRYVALEELKWAQGFLGKWADSPVMKQYRVTAIPTILLIDPSGMIVADNLHGRAAIMKALAKALPADPASQPKVLGGRILSTAGKPAAEAEIYAILPPYTSYFSGAKCGPNSAFTPARTKADKQGRFRLPSPKCDWLLFALHDGGWALVDQKHGAETSDIRLRPYARIEGRLRIGNRAGAGEDVTARFSTDCLARRSMANVDYSRWTKTDSEGRFVLERMLPGRLSVSRNVAIGTGVWGSQSGILCTVSAGETGRVTLGGTGRPVTGRVVLKRGAERLDFSEGCGFFGDHRRGTLRPKRPRFEPAPEFYKLSQDARAKWAKRWKQSDQWKAYVKACHDHGRRYVGGSFVIRRDGGFRIDDVPAGKYELHVKVYGPPRSKWERGALVGSSETEFTVPEMPDGRSDAPLKVGVVLARPTGDQPAEGRAPPPAPTAAGSKGAPAQPATATAPAAKGQELTLDGAQVTNESLEKLKGLRLESLMLHKAAVTDEALARLTGVGSLKKLYLRTTPGIRGPGLAHLQAVRGLESLELWGTSVDEKSLVHLVGMRGLRELSLPFMPLTEAGLARLGKMTNLRRLNLYGCPVTDAGLAKLEPLKGLEGLDLTHTRVTDAGLERLKAFRNLKALSVGSHEGRRGAISPISDAGVAHLAALANLEALHFVGPTAVTDEGLKHLAGLKRLKHLSLVGTNASGHALKEFRDLPELERLMLSGSQAAAGIEHLAAMKKLSSVWIVGQFGGEFDMEWMQRLRGVLPPGCSIGWSD